MGINLERTLELIGTRVIARVDAAVLVENIDAEGRERGKGRIPSIPMKMTAVTVISNGKKVQTFINLPQFNGKSVLSQETAEKMMDDLGVERGDTVSFA